ncbi:MAG: hypothetical protein AAF387_17335 [Pseudomonadota bacterium]
MNDSASESQNAYSVSKLTEEARRLAADYRRATGKSLPLSPEIAINDAIRLLGMSASEDDYCDAVYTRDGAECRVIVKGRAIFDKTRSGQRIGQLKFDKPWDEALLVIMDEDYETTEIYRANRDTMAAALAEKAENKRGAMTVSQFKIIATKIWPHD